MKKIFFLIIIFCLYTCLIYFCPFVTQLDRSIIFHVQNILKPLPVIIPLLPDCALYSAMIVIPLTISTFLFAKKKMYADLFFFLSIPLITFILNCIIKPIIKRPRPPYEMQLSIHPDSFSYVSSHSLVTITLYGMIIWYIYKYSEKLWLKKLILIIGILWTLFVGFSRIWLGVHNPSDVLGAYFLGTILVLIYTKFIK